MAALKGRKNTIREVSRNAGHTYATRILPYRLRVTRDYFVKGTNNFEIANARPRQGNGMKRVNCGRLRLVIRKAKIAGRACYNMAIINEINGSLNVPGMGSESLGGL